MRGPTGQCLTVRHTGGSAEPRKWRRRRGRPVAERERLRCRPVSVRNLESMFNPTHVAVVGAGGERMQLGHIVLRNLVDAGFEGVVYPINRSREAVGGIQAYARIADTPAKTELAIVCTPAATVPEVVRECGEAGVVAVAVLSAGFREVGSEGLALEHAVAEELGRHDGMRLLGPNCLGLIVPRLGLNASFARAMPGDGQIALLSQSGALATSMIDWALAERVGFAHVISVGNMLDIDLGDVIDYLGTDRQTRSIILYVESVTNPRKFMSAARAAARNKPIIVYKAGRFAGSAKAAVSHTGAMAGEDAVYDAAFRRAGLVRVERIEDAFATAELLARERRVRRGRLAIVTNAGGPGVMAADALLARGGELAEPTPETLAALDAALPPAWSHANPIDVLGDAPPQRFADAVKAALADTDVDGVLVILTPQATTDAARTADAVLEAQRERSKIGQPKPILAAWMGGDSVREGAERLTAGGVATYTYPEQAIGAFMDLVSYARNLETLHETPRTIPVSFALDRGRAKALMGPVLAERHGVMSETLSKTLLDAYEIPVTKPLPALSSDDAVASAEQIGYPVVLKVRSPEITHKTDVGGVELNLASAAAVRAAYDRIVASVGKRRPDAEVQGVTVQRSAPDTGYELVLGARKDATFGAVILIGAGGVAAELLHDQALGLPPLNESLALAMLHSLRIWPLLAGYRGRPGVNLDLLLEVVMRFSYLIADYPEISEIEINPLLAGMDGAVALDARAVVDESLVGRPTPPPFSHLAIRPYPEEYERKATTTGGLEITLRPIRPEDEPLWHEMLDACSPESIHMRFRALVKHTHEMATRYCFIDYDRELAIVAELEAQDGAHKLLGVGRLVADPDHQSAEYAVLVADPWQGRGLSDLLTDYCLEIARSWGILTVRAETTPDNARMIGVLKKHGFPLTRRVGEGIVVGERRP
jgi:acetyltransferase